MNTKVSTPITIITIVIALIIVGIGVWYVRPQYQNNTIGPGDGGGIACTQDAKECPDGSYVGRTGPHCEFAACPMAASSTPITTTTPSSTPGRGAGAFCGGIAAGAFPCDPGYSCRLDGTYPDAGGHCVKN